MILYIYVVKYSDILFRSYVLNRMEIKIQVYVRSYLLLNTSAILMKGKDTTCTIVKYHRFLARKNS